MIKLSEKKDCCGCEACVQRCPKECIEMRLDEEGFSYPRINERLCIDCGLCEKVCPVINRSEKRQPVKVYASENKNETVRKESSSGGIFTLLAEQVIEEGGVVFGARFNENWEVVHSYCESKEELAQFRGSKYVQSCIGRVFLEAESFIKAGRKVLFSGTPCQIAGLRLFLKKEYENLLTIDFVCHGVPSSGVFQKYLREIIARKGGRKNSVFTHPNPAQMRDISRIYFRDKSLGWKKFSFSLTLSTPAGVEQNTVFLSEPLNKNIYLKGFLSNLYLRPSCHACPVRDLKSGSDITLGDYWGITRVHPAYRNDDKGVSLVLVNTEKGFLSYERISEETTSLESDFRKAVAINPSIAKDVDMPCKRKDFFTMYKDRSFSLIDSVSLLTRESKIVRWSKFIRRVNNRMKFEICRRIKK